MRLLCVKTQTLHEFFADKIPPYATLSHTWEADEITFEDITDGHSYRESKKGWAKDALEFVWIDTCCINKSNSMSIECYVYVADFSHPGLNAESQEKQSALERYRWSRWFTRGWTLQELLAPPSVRFFDSTWLEFGDKISLQEQISRATGISRKVLVDSAIDIHQALDYTCIAQKMSWASRRTTTREEDITYCLLGIFDVNMPLLYGEGPKAFQRLQEEIIKKFDDQSILAWGFKLEDRTLWSVSTALSRSPWEFYNCGGITSRGAAAPGDGFSITQRGLRLDLPVIGEFNNGDILYCILNCTMAATGSKAVTTRLLAVPLARCLLRVDGAKPKPDEYYRLYLVRPRLDCNLVFGPLHPDYFIAGKFPPERSTGSLLNLTLHNQHGTSYVIIHIATNLQQPGHLVVMKGRSLSEGSTIFDSLYKEDSRSDSLEPNKHLLLPLNKAQLREVIIEPLAAVLGLESSEINSTFTLEKLLDSISMVRLVIELRLRTGVDISLSILSYTKTVKDLENKLRFATRSYFRDIASGERSRFEIPRSTIDRPQFAIVEVEPNASLIQLLTKADLLETAKFTNDTSEAILQLSKSLQLNVMYYHDSMQVEVLSEEI
ncbi:heterokaryon incompatibility domain-containing protein [Trichoderma chlorosporum]